MPESMKDEVRKFVEEALVSGNPVVVLSGFDYLATNPRGLKPDVALRQLAQAVTQVPFILTDGRPAAARLAALLYLHDEIARCTKNAATPILKLLLDDTDANNPSVN